MKKAFLIVLFIMTAFVCASCASNTKRKVVSLDNDWSFIKGNAKGAEKVAYDDNSWQQLSIPHTWNATDVLEKGTDYYKGPGWYRRRIMLSKDDLQNRLFLRFEGALAVADVYVNGQKAGIHQGGYSAFCFEITDLVQGGHNLLAVRVDNSYNENVIPPKDTLFSRFGGMYRPVWLISTDRACITPLDYASSGVYLQQTKVTNNKAEIDVIAKISNGYEHKQPFTVIVEIKDNREKTVASSEKQVSIEADETKDVAQGLIIHDPHLWHGRKDPYLYKAVVNLKHNGKIIDTNIQPLGLRYFHVDADKGLMLNGEYYNLYGVCRHQEVEGIGSALTNDHHRQDIDIILEMGATGIRLAHYQQSDTIYRLCDEKGLVCWAEIPVTQSYVETAFENAKQQLIELIRQNYNHPSILFVGLHNEAPIPPQQVKILNVMAKKEDPQRLTTAASPWTDTSTVTDLICWNRYPGWYDPLWDQTADIGSTWADPKHKKQPDLKFGVSEYGGGGCISHQKQNPERPDPGYGKFFPEQNQTWIHEQIWPDMDIRRFLWCKYIWNGFDFTVSGWNRGDRPNLNHKGLVTYDRKNKKDAFYYYKANWSDVPMVYITSRRHVNRTEPVTDIKVYSTCPQMDLYVNGKKQSAIKPDNYKTYSWNDIILMKGENQIKVIGKRDGKTFEDVCYWTLRPKRDIGQKVGNNFFLQLYQGTRNNYSGWVGYEFIPNQDITINGLGRPVSGMMGASHEVKIWKTSDKSVVAGVTVTASSPQDSLGYACEELVSPVMLRSGLAYRIASAEISGGDQWRDAGEISNHSPLVRINTGVWGDGSYPRHTHGNKENGYVPATFYISN